MPLPHSFIYSLGFPLLPRSAFSSESGNLVSRSEGKRFHVEWRWYQRLSWFRADERYGETEESKKETTKKRKAVVRKKETKDDPQSLTERLEKSTCQQRLRSMPMEGMQTGKIQWTRSCLCYDTKNVRLHTVWRCKPLYSLQLYRIISWLTNICYSSLSYPPLLSFPSPLFVHDVIENSVGL